MTVKILQGHCLDVLKTMPDESVHCVVTSPPYLGLRDYGVEPQMWGGDDRCEHEWGDTLISLVNDSNRGTMNWTTGWDPASKVLGQKVSQGQFCQLCGAWRGSLGLEPTPELFISHLVQIFREVRRVLRKDGTIWVNIGDSYAASRSYQVPDNKNVAVGPTRHLGRATPPTGLKQKDLIGIPWLLAFALRADGYFLRSDIIWQKPNCLPESVQDRPTKSHEYIFLLSKSQKYFYDQEAIREPCSWPNSWSASDTHTAIGQGGKHGKTSIFKQEWVDKGVGRNRRSVWSISTKPFSGCHFATFPPALIEPCILAGCPAKVCAKCGAPYRKVIERTVEPPPDRINNNSFAHDPLTTHGEGATTLRNVVKTSAAGEIPTCDCNAGTVAGTVLDPFGGSGTTGKVSEDLGRHSILIELKPEYVKMIERRTAQMGLFAMGG